MVTLHCLIEKLRTLKACRTERVAVVVWRVRVYKNLHISYSAVPGTNLYPWWQPCPTAPTGHDCTARNAPSSPRYACTPLVRYSTERFVLGLYKPCIFNAVMLLDADCPACLCSQLHFKPCSKDCYLACCALWSKLSHLNILFSFFFFSPGLHPHQSPAPLPNPGLYPPPVSMSPGQPPPQQLLAPTYFSAPGVMNFGNPNYPYAPGALPPPPPPPHLYPNTQVR